MDRGAWRATVHGSKESDRTEQLTLTFTQLFLTLFLVPLTFPPHWVLHTYQPKIVVISAIVYSAFIYMLYPIC